MIGSQAKALASEYDRISKSSWLARRRFKQEVLRIENDWKTAVISYKNCPNPLEVLFKYICQVLFLVSGAVWLLLLSLSVIPKLLGMQPIFGFIGHLLAAASSFPLLSQVFFGYLVFGLVAATVKGSIKLGLRFLIVPIHVIEYKSTLANSFLANSLLILSASLGILHLCSISFYEYARYTPINTLFTVQIQSIIGFKYIYLAGSFGIVIMSGLTLCWSILRAGCKRRTK